MLYVIIFSGPVDIRSPQDSRALIVDRERVVATGEEVMFVCSTEGFPPPGITWYYNGAPISSLNGVSVSGNQLNVLNPQVNHSGVYQCLARNMLPSGFSEDSRAWILEVRLQSIIE